MLIPGTVRCISDRIALKVLIVFLSVHAWNYRRYALANMPERKPETAELAYTARKIESNFSNFSAWHQRSKVFGSLWDQGKVDPVKSRAEGDDPFYISSICERWLTVGFRV